MRIVAFERPAHFIYLEVLMKLGEWQNSLCTRGHRESEGKSGCETERYAGQNTLKDLKNKPYEGVTVGCATKMAA